MKSFANDPSLDRVLLISREEMGGAAGGFDPLHPVYTQTEGADPFTYRNDFCHMRLLADGTVELTESGRPARFAEEWRQLLSQLAACRTLTDLRIYDYDGDEPPMAAALTTYGRLLLYGNAGEYAPAAGWQGVARVFWDTDGFGALCEDEMFRAVGALSALDGIGEIEEAVGSALPGHCSPVAYLLQKNGTVTLFEQNWIWDGKAGVNRVIPYDGGCYTFYTMMSASGRAAAAEEGLANTPVSDAPSVTPVSASAGLTAWGSGVSSITGTPSAWAADTITRAEIYGITMLSDGSYQSPITRRTLARLAANTARTLGLVEDVSDPIAAVQQLGVMQPNADGSFDQTSKVTRQMAATVLLRLLRQSSTVFDADYSTLSRYPDSAAISDWAREAVAMMTQYELMNGTSKGFEPKKEMTLEQCLVLLTRICEF